MIKNGTSKIKPLKRIGSGNVFEAYTKTVLLKIFNKEVIFYGIRERVPGGTNAEKTTVLEITRESDQSLHSHLQDLKRSIWDLRC